MPRLDPIVIVPADPAWPASFERERRRLEPEFGGSLVRPIEHIGSTSVPGLCAKAIIDMLAVVDDIDALDLDLPAGWVPAPEPGDDRDRRRSYCSPSVERRTHHLHVVEASSDGWRGWLAFRDHLRSHPVVAGEYGALKRRLSAELASADPDDRAAYRSGKADFIRAVTASALASG